MDATLMTAGGMTLLFAGLTWQQWRWVRRARASTSWPRVPGTVRRSESLLGEHRVNRFGPRFYQSNVLHYTYHVAGSRYTGHRLSFGISAPVRAEQDSDLHGRFTRGDTVSVAVDPADPAYAVLEPGARPALYVELGVYLFVTMLVAGWFLVYSVA